MPMPIVTSIISAISILAGSLLGALFSWIISKKIHIQGVEDEHKIIEENRKYDEKFRAKEICNNANCIRLDFATAIFQSIRSIRNKEEKKKYLYILPINKEYSKAVASLSDKYTLKELSYIYQLYGIMEKVNRDINSWNLGDKESYNKVKQGFETILYKIYGENAKKILLINPEEISYSEIYNNDFIKDYYKEILTRLDELCILDNLLIEES